MNDEIKEMLELFGSTDENIMFCDIVELNSKQSHLLLDYITNLQQENERLKNEPLTNKLGRIDSVVANIYRNNKEQEDYKSRCEKADNQLKIIMQIIKEQPTRNVEDDEWIENRLIGVVNILKNGSEENERKQ